MWFNVGVEVEQETSAPPPKKNPGSAPALSGTKNVWLHCHLNIAPDFKNNYNLEQA